MPQNGKKYTFQLDIDNKSLQDITDKLSDALSKGADEGWDRSSMSDVKEGFGKILKYGQQTAQQLGKEMGDALDISDLSPKAKLLFDNLDAILDVTSQISTAMKETGGSLEWMKQGVTLADDMINLKAAMEKLPLDRFDKMEAAMERTSLQFQGFFDALKVTQSDAFFKRFGDSADKATRQVDRVKAQLTKAMDFSDIRSVIETAQSNALTVDDLLDMDEEELQQEYDNIKGTIRESLNDIRKMELDYLAQKNKKKLSSKDKEALYQNKDYQGLIGELASAYSDLETLQEHLRKSSGLAISIDTSEIENTVQEAVNLIKDAKGDLEKAIKGLDLKDIELSIVIPDAKSAEWSSKINDLITETQNQFDAEPIKVTFDYLNPIKMKRGKKLTEGQKQAAESVATEFAEYYKQYMQEQVEEADQALEPIISQDKDKPGVLFDKQTHVNAEKFLSSFLNLAKTVTTAQDVLLKHTQAWREKMDGELKLKFKWDSKESEDDQREDLAWLFQLAQDEAKKYPIGLKINEDEFIGQIENALKDRTFDVDINVGDIKGNIISGMPMAPAGGNVVFVPNGGVNSPVPPVPMESLTPPTPPATPVIDEDDDIDFAPSAESIITDSTKTASEVVDSNDALGKIIQGLANDIAANDERIRKRTQDITDAKAQAEQNQPQIKALEANIAAKILQLDTIHRPNVEGNQAELNAINKQIAELEQTHKSRQSEGSARLRAAKQAGASVDELNAIKAENTARAVSYNEELQTLKAMAAAKKRTVRDFQADVTRVSNIIKADEEEIEKLKLTATIADAEKEIDKADKANAVLKRRKAGLSDPVGAVVQTNKKFWQNSDNRIKSAKNTITDNTKNIQQLETKLTTLKETLKNTTQGTDKYIATQKEIAQVEASLTESRQAKYKAEQAQATWEARQVYMSEKGFVRNLDKTGAQKLISSNSGRTIASELLAARDVTGREKLVGGLSPIQDIAYFINATRESLGLITQSTEAYENTRAVQERLLNIARLAKWLKDMQLLVKEGEVASEADIQKFIDVYEGTEQLSEVIAAAKQHLETNAKVAEASKGNDLYQLSAVAGITKEYFIDAAKNALAGLSDGAKQELARMLTKSGVKVGKTVNISALQQAFDNGAFNDANIGRAYQGEFKGLAEVLNLRSLHMASENALKSVYEQATRRLSSAERLQREKGDKDSSFVSGNRQYAGGAKRVTRATLDDQEPIYVRKVDDKGNEITYELKGRNKAGTAVDNSMNTSETGITRFLKETGLEDIINEIITKELSSNSEDQKRARELQEQLFSSDKWTFSAKKDDIVKTSAKTYKYGSTQYAMAEGTIGRKNRQKELGKVQWTPRDQQELENAEAALKDRNNVLAAIEALDNDIIIANAQVKEAEAHLGQRQKDLRNLTGNKSVAYGEVRSASAVRINSAKQQSIEGLRDQIKVAGDYGTIKESVVSELNQLMEARDAAFTELSQMAPDKDLSPEQREHKEALTQQLAKYKEKIAQKFYTTEGWYVTELLTSRLKAVDREFDQAMNSADAAITQAQNNMGGDNAAVRLDKEHEAAKTQINNNIDSLIDEMVNEPIRAVNEQLEADKAKAKKNHKKYVEPSQAEKDALYVKAINDYLLQQAKSKTSETKQKEKNTLLAQRESLLSDKSTLVEQENRAQLKTEFDDQIEQLQNKRKSLAKYIERAKNQPTPISEYELLRRERSNAFDEKARLGTEKDKQIRALNESKNGKTASQIAEIDQQITALEKEYEENIAALNSKIKELEPQMEEARKKPQVNAADALSKESNEMREEIDRLKEEKTKRIRELTEAKYGTSPQIAALDAQIAALEAEEAEATSKVYKPVASVQEAKERLEQQRNAAIEAEVERYAEAVSQVVDSDKEQENIVAQAENAKQDAIIKRNQAMQESVSSLKTTGGAFKTNLDAMTDFAREGKNSAETALQAATIHAAALDAKKKALENEVGSLETVTVRQQEAAEQAKESAKAAEKHADAMPAETPKSTPATQQPQYTTTAPTGGYYTYAPGAMAINTEGLATESTLRGIYELLNGGAPVGGWPETSNQFEQQLSDWSDGLGDTTENFAKSINKIITSADTRKKEAGFLINRYGQVGKTIQGAKHNVPADKVTSELAQNIANGVLAFLHNHPGKNSQHLSPGDIQASAYMAYDQGHEPVPITGSVNDGVISAINWSNIDKDLAQQILGRYKQLIAQWQSTMPDAYTYDEQSKRYKANADYIETNPELIKTISAKYNEILIQTLTEFGAQDAYKQFTNAEDFRKFVLNEGTIQEATQTVAENIVEQGAQAAIEAVPLPSQAEIDAADAAEQAEIDKIVEELWNEMYGEAKQKAVSSLAEEIKRGEIEGDDYDYSLQHGIDRSATESSQQVVEQAQAQVTENILENGAEAAKQVAAQAEITVDKDKLNAFKSQLDQRYQREKKDRENKVDNPYERPKDEKPLSENITRMSNHLFKDYSQLSKAEADKSLTQLAYGYVGLIKFIETEFYESLKDDTKLLINQAIESANNVLNANDIHLHGLDLVGTVVQESYNKTLNGKQLMYDSQKDKKTGKNNPIKVGQIISKAYPAVVRGNNELLSPAYITSHNPKTKEEKQLAAEVLSLEQKTTAEKEKQDKLETKTTEKEKASAQAAQEQAAAEEKISEEKHEQQEAETPKTTHPEAQPTPPAAPAQSSESVPVSGSNVPQGGNHPGGLINDIKNALNSGQFNTQVISILKDLAREDTLSGIAALLATSTFGGGSGNGGSQKPPQNADLNADDALKQLRTEIAQLTDVTHISDLRASAKGYSLDVYRKELDQIQKITFNINKNTGEITSKTGLQQLARGADAAERELRRVVDLTDQLYNSGALQVDANGADFSNNKTVQNFLSAVNELKQYRSSLSTDELLAPENQKRLSQMTLTVQNYRKQIEELLQSTAKYKDERVIGEIVDSSVAGDVTKAKQAMESVITATADGKVTFDDMRVVTDRLGNSHYELSYILQKGKHEVQEMTAVLNPLTHEIIAQQKALKAIETPWERFFKGFKGKFSSLVQYTISATSIHDLIRYFKQGIQYVREIDAALTELKKVTEGTNTIYTQFLKNMSQVAGVVGSTTSELTQSAADWARLGFSIQEAGLLAQNTAVLMNVSEFKDVNTATEALISSLQAFGYEAENSIEIVDKLNIVGNNFAISSDGIASGLQRSASTLVAAGNSLEQSIAMLAAGNKVVQDPEALGNALKVLSMRIRGTKTDLEDAGEETDGMIVNTSKLQEKIMALTNVNGSGGVDILTESGEFRSTYDILYDIAEVWDQINTVDPKNQAALLEILAGKTRGSQVAAILQNFEDLDKAYKTALNSEGSAMEENEKYLDSIQGRIDLITNSIQAMWFDELDSELIKLILDLVNGLIKVVDTLGLIPTALAAIFTYSTVVKKSFSWIDMFADLGTNKIPQAATWGKNLITNILPKKQVQTAADDIAETIEDSLDNIDFSSMVDTSDIDAQIAQKATELAQAEQKLKALPKGKGAWDYYYKLGSKAPAKDRDNRISEAKKEVDDLKASLQELNQQKVDSITVQTQQIKAEMQQTAQQTQATANGFDLLQARVAALPKGQILEMPDTNALQAHIDGFNALNTEAARAQWIAENIDDLTDAEVRYFNTVQDGSASVRAAQQSVNEYNTSLQQSSSKLAGLFKGLGNMLISGLVSVGITLLISGIIKLIDNAVHRTEKLIDKWKTAQQEVEGLNEELKTIQSRIDELEAKGVLSLTDKKELDLLRQENDELERRLRLAQRAEEDAAKETRAAVQRDYQTKFNSNVYKSEATELDLERKRIADNVEEGLNQLQMNPLLAFDDLAQSQQDAIKQTDEAVYNLLKNNSWSELTQEEMEKVQTVLKQAQKDIEDLAFTNDPSALITGPEKIDQEIQRIHELKAEYNALATEYQSVASNQSLSDEEQASQLATIDTEAAAILDKIETSETTLATLSVTLSEYLSDYPTVEGGDAFIDGIQAQLEQIDKAINPLIYYQDKFDEIFGKYSDEQQALYELAMQGQLTADALNNTTYQPLMDELKKLDITTQDVVDHITSLSHAELNKIVDPTFVISDYADSFDVVQDNISSLQSALTSLQEGSFTYSDFIDLTQQYPELAEGVEVLSGNFKGLSKNLLKAIKASPDELVDELKALSKQMRKNGKDTKNIDQMITSLEKLPVDIVDDLASKYTTLADAINDANEAQGALAKAMEGNSNENYESTSEAVQKMREMYANGAYGSESEIWDIFEALTGHTYDFSKSLEANKDVLKDWINTYSSFYLGEDDGEYAHKPIEKFLDFMEAKVAEAQEKGEEWALATTWSYENGTANIDYDNKYLEDMAKAAGLTEGAFYDLMMQVAQFWEVVWEDSDDVVDHMQKTFDTALESGANADETIQSLADAMNYFNRGDVDLTNRPEVPFDMQHFEGWANEYMKILIEPQRYTEDYVKWAKDQLDSILAGDSTATIYTQTYYKSDFRELGEGEEDAAIVVTPILPDKTVLSPQALEGYAEQLLNGEKIDLNDGITLGIFSGEGFKEQAAEFAEGAHEAQAIYYDAVETFSADNIISQINDGGVEALDQIEEIRDSVSKGASGEVFIDTDSLIQTLTEAQYTEDAIVAVIDRLNDLSNVTLYDENSDPFGLYKATGSAKDMVAALEGAGIAVQKTFSSDGGANSYIYDIDVREMSEVLASRGWTTNDIVSYINAATGSYGDGDIFANMGVSVDTTDIDAALGKIETFPEDAQTDYTINVDPTFKAINDEWADLTKEKKVDYVINRKTVYSMGFGGFDFANGTAHARGTAFAGGDWGAKKSETALVGELGTEMVVRGNRWFTVGDNGAEFTDIKKGDIIFNHKQTESLLSKGYVTGRGKAYASGTAYSITSGFNNFPANPTDIGWKGDLDDTLDDAKDLIDFIEIKLEEIEAEISKTTAEITNLVDDTTAEGKKRDMYNTLVSEEQKKQGVYGYAADYYDKKANELYQKIAKKYRDESKYGAIAVKDFVGEGETKQAEIIQEYRDMVAKADEAKVAELEATTRIEEIRLEQFNDLADDYENRISLIEAESNLINTQMELQEAKGERLSPKYYEELTERTESTKDELTNQRAQMIADLNAAVASNEVQKGSDAWYEMKNAIAEVDEALIQCDIDMEEFQNSINDLHWDNFDKLLDQFDNLDSELSNIYDRLTDIEEVADKDGNWADESVAAIGVAAQQMELAKARAQQYADQLAYLETHKADYSVDEYNEKLAELKEGQWESIEAYEDAKDAIIDLNKARIDAIKEGIEEEIDAYKELIDKKKEALDADKDLYDFEKNVAEQQKEIADIQRQISALSGDTSTSATAQRKKLEAELLEAQAELEDTYYDRSVENQKNALDNSYEQFEEEKNDEVEALDTYLENEEQVVIDSLNTVKTKADVVLGEIKTLSTTYGIEISSAIKQPWEEGSNTISVFSTQFGAFQSTFTTQLSNITSSYLELTAAAREAAIAMFEAANGNPGSIGGNVSGGVAGNSGGDLNIGDNSKGAGEGTVPASGSQAEYDEYTVKSGDTLWDIAKTYLGSGSQYTEIAAANDSITNPNKIYIGQKIKIPKHAKGTLSTPDDEWAWIDEIGEELVLHADGSGKLSYLTKGSSVIPADITAKLMNLALDPTQTLENSRPIISAPQITNNEINIDMRIAEVVHIDTVTNDTIPDLTKAVEKQMDKYMKQLNGQIRKFAR